ncbi:MAG: hypothetical protein K0S65_3797 [Labilithrix sp.]|nr:hypothetical protein [Labilithrix sp.]
MSARKCPGEVASRCRRPRRRRTGGKKFAPRFTDKARVEDYIRGFYTNLLEFYPPRMEGDRLVFPIYCPVTSVLRSSIR